MFENVSYSFIKKLKGTFTFEVRVRSFILIFCNSIIESLDNYTLKTVLLSGFCFTHKVCESIYIILYITISLSWFIYLLTCKMTFSIFYTALHFPCCLQGTKRGNLIKRYILQRICHLVIQGKNQILYKMLFNMVVWK